MPERGHDSDMPNRYCNTARKIEYITNERIRIIFAKGDNRVRENSIWCKFDECWFLFAKILPGIRGAARVITKF